MQQVLMLLFTSFCFVASAQDQSAWKSPAVRENLYDLRQQEINQGANFEELNKNLLESIDNYSPQPNSERAVGINREQAQQLLNELKSENFFINSKEQYDNKQNLGLCFGRSIYLHLMLLKYGVNKDSIKKIFVIGPMDSGTPDKTWQFHVATIVKDQRTGRWWVLDTDFDSPLLLADWVYQMKRRALDKTFRIFRSTLVDKTKALRFYITDAHKIGPSGWEYNIKAGGLFDPFYNNYFQDMFKVLKTKHIPLSERFNSSLLSCRRLF